MKTSAHNMELVQPEQLSGVRKLLHKSNSQKRKKVSTEGASSPFIRQGFGRVSEKRTSGRFKSDNSNVTSHDQMNKYSLQHDCYNDEDAVLHNKVISDCIQLASSSTTAMSNAQKICETYMFDNRNFLHNVDENNGTIGMCLPGPKVFTCKVITTLCASVIKTALTLTTFALATLVNQFCKIHSLQCHLSLCFETKGGNIIT